MKICLLKTGDFDTYDQYLEVADYCCLELFKQKLVAPETRFKLFFATEVQNADNLQACDLLESTVFGKSCGNLSIYGHFIVKQIQISYQPRLYLICV